MVAVDYKGRLVIGYTAGKEATLEEIIDIVY